MRKIMSHQKDHRKTKLCLRNDVRTAGGASRRRRRRLLPPGGGGVWRAGVIPSSERAWAPCTSWEGGEGGSTLTALPAASTLWDDPLHANDVKGRMYTWHTFETAHTHTHTHTHAHAYTYTYTHTHTHTHTYTHAHSDTSGCVLPKCSSCTDFFYVSIQS
ncbi:unnamed protein product [Boreogadus saida]